VEFMGIDIDGHILISKNGLAEIAFGDEDYVLAFCYPRLIEGIGEVRVATVIPLGTPRVPVPSDPDACPRCGDVDGNETTCNTCYTCPCGDNECGS
jgi:hypothetical protein